MKFKELLYTEQGYSYIKCKKEDCFNWGGLAICDSCGENIEDDVYLIYILSQAFCPKCFKEWNQHSKRYESDIQLQKKNHERWYFVHGFKTF